MGASSFDSVKYLTSRFYKEAPMSSYSVDAASLESLSAQLKGFAQTIDETNATAMNRVDGVAGATWTGEAAQQFQALFTQWKSGADQTRQAMEGIGVLVDNAAKAYSETEHQVARSMSQ
jgi:WXG100 family type VII secretion target